MSLPTDLQPKPGRVWTADEVAALSPAEFETHQADISASIPSMVATKKAATATARDARNAARAAAQAGS